MVGLGQSLTAPGARALEVDGQQAIVHRTQPSGSA
jgi:hypothetical protein